jgi:CrcB protein
MKYVLIAAGGGAGSLLRYVAGTAVMTRMGARFPWGTLVVNVTGCLLIGFLMTLFTERFSPGTNWRPLLVIGFLGGYTTFSSFEWETYAAARDGNAWLGLANVIGSVVLGYAAVWLGAMLARR